MTVKKHTFVLLVLKLVLDTLKLMLLEILTLDFVPLVTIAQLVL
jgi:hypothetical protein